MSDELSDGMISSRNTCGSVGYMRRRTVGRIEKLAPFESFFKYRNEICAKNRIKLFFSNDVWFNIFFTLIYLFFFQFCQIIWDKKFEYCLFGTLFNSLLSGLSRMFGKLCYLIINSSASRFKIKLNKRIIYILVCGFLVIDIKKVKNVDLEAEELTIK